MSGYLSKRGMVNCTCLKNGPLKFMMGEKLDKEVVIRTRGLTRHFTTLCRNLLEVDDLSIEVSKLENLPMCPYLSGRTNLEVPA